MPQEQQYYTTGAVRDEKDSRDYLLSGIMPITDIPKQVFELPDDYDSKIQWGRGSCTSQSGAHHKQRQEKTMLSARFVMAIVKSVIEQNNQWGAYTRNTFKAINDKGVCKESLWPEPGPEMSWEEYIDINKIPPACFTDAANHKSESYWSVPKMIDGIRNVLVEKNQSVVISMAWYNQFNRPVNGFLPVVYSGDCNGHAVEIKGFDDFKECFIVKNSWGEGWGVNGDFYLPYSIFYDVVWDAWCSLDYPAELPVDNYYGGYRTWSGYLREKALGLNPWLLGKIKRLPTRREIIGLAYGFYEYEAVFLGKYGDLWLKMTKPEARKQGLICVS